MVNTILLILDLISNTKIKLQVKGRWLMWEGGGGFGISNKILTLVMSF